MIKEMDYKRRRVTLSVNGKVIEEREMTDEDMQLHLFSDIPNRLPSLPSKTQPQKDFTCQNSNPPAQSSR
jgi:hypothetical protein